MANKWHQLDGTNKSLKRPLNLPILHVLPISQPQKPITNYHNHKHQLIIRRKNGNNKAKRI